jgi:hypothetical protein
MGIAAVEVGGPAEVREGLRRAMAGDLAEAEAEGLAVRLDTLAELLAPGR